MIVRGRRLQRRLMQLDETIIEFLSHRQLSDKISPFTSQIISIDNIINVLSIFVCILCVCMCLQKDTERSYKFFDIQNITTLRLKIHH